VGLFVRPVTWDVSGSGLQSVLGPPRWRSNRNAGESRIVRPSVRAERPEANGDLHKRTANGLTLDGSACDYFRCRADLRGSQPARLLAG